MVGAVTRRPARRALRCRRPELESLQPWWSPSRLSVVEGDGGLVLGGAGRRRLMIGCSGARRAGGQGRRHSSTSLSQSGIRGSGDVCGCPRHPRHIPRRKQLKSVFGECGGCGGCFSAFSIACARVRMCVGLEEFPTSPTSPEAFVFRALSRGLSFAHPPLPPDIPRPPGTRRTAARMHRRSRRAAIGRNGARRRLWMRTRTSRSTCGHASARSKGRSRCVGHARSRRRSEATDHSGGPRRTEVSRSHLSGPEPVPPRRHEDAPDSALAVGRFQHLIEVAEEALDAGDLEARRRAPAPSSRSCRSCAFRAVVRRRSTPGRGSGRRRRGERGWRAPRS